MLQHLSTHTDEKNRKEGAEERRALIGKAGGVEALTEAMERHPSVAKLLKYAFVVLRNLCVDNDDNRRRVAQAGGVEVVVKAMNNHPSAELLLEQACAVLQNLSTHTEKRNRKLCEDRRALIGKAGGVEAVTKAMQKASIRREAVEIRLWGA